jgi:hypothetical protein
MKNPKTKFKPSREYMKALAAYFAWVVGAAIIARRKFETDKTEDADFEIIEPKALPQSNNNDNENLCSK